MASLVLLISVCVAPAVSFLGVSPCGGPSCPPVHVFMRAFLLIWAKLEYISPAEETTGYSLMGSNIEVKINAVSSFSKPKIACACFSCDNLRKWGDSLFLHLFNVFGECCALVLKSSCYEEQTMWSRLLWTFMDPDLTRPEMSPKKNVFLSNLYCFLWKLPVRSLMVRVANNWNWLYREIVESLPLEMVYKLDWTSPSNQL